VERIGLVLSHAPSEEEAMGLLFRRRSPLMRLAAGGAVGGAASDEDGGHVQHVEADEDTPPDPTGDLERLARLHRTGALTDAEFAAAKSRLLGV
jgi:hypothetical protein